MCVNACVWVWTHLCAFRAIICDFFQRFQPDLRFGHFRPAFWANWEFRNGGIQTGIKMGIKPYPTAWWLWISTFFPNFFVVICSNWWFFYAHILKSVHAFWFSEKSVPGVLGWRQHVGKEKCRHLEKNDEYQHFGTWKLYVLKRSGNFLTECRNIEKNSVYQRFGR